MTTEYKKRLCDLVNLEENNRSCVVLTVKPETSPLDLVKLGGFEGHECMFRMSKDPRTTCITVFRDGDEPYHMNYGGSNTMVGEARRKVRDLIKECVNLDFGIFTHEPIAIGSFDSLVEETSGHRDLDSTRSFTLKHAPNYSSLFVNDQHVANIDNEALENWLIDRNARLDVRDTEHKGLVDVDRGYVRRVYAPEHQQGIEAPEEPLGSQERFERAIDEAGKAFLAEGGWQGKDAAGVVQAFTEFIKKRGIGPNPSLEDAVGKAKEKAAERNADRKRNPRSPRPRWLGR